MFIIQLILIQIITFATLVFFLRKIMITSSFSETQRLQHLNQENKKKAQELAKKVDDAQIDYRKKIQEAEEQVKQLRAKAAGEAQEVKEKVLEEAKKEKEFIIRQAVNEKDKMREEIADEMRKSAGEHAREMMRKVLSSKNQQLLHHGLIEEILIELEGVDKEVFLQGEVNISIKTARAMSEEHKKKLSSILSSKMDGDITIGEIIDETMIGGMVIKIGSLVIDGSLKGKL